MRLLRQRLHPSYKIWLTSRGGYVIGKGGASLFKGIEKYGSISKAAEELGWSYKYAWDQLREMESKLGAPVVVRKRGGATGGGAKLTELAKSLLGKYEEIERSVKRTIRARSQELALR